MVTRALNEVESKRLLADAGIPVTPCELARSAAAAREAAERIGYPVAVKIVSPDVVHKSDVGGVRLGVTTGEAVQRAFDDLLATVRARQPGARIDGVAVQPMAPPGGVEVIVGVSVDPQFGHVLMCGLGGLLVEVLGDVAFRLVPLAPRDARALFADLRGGAVLHGVRGRPGVSLPALEALVLGVSHLIERRPDIRELDLNPVLAYPDHALAVDARALVEVAA